MNPALKEGSLYVIRDYDGTFYYKDALCRIKHNPHGPAIETILGKQKIYEYWLNGERHRTDGPALIRGGHKQWWANGQLHRVDGPAVVSSDGTTEEWWVNGERHRLDGPASIKLGFNPGWFLFGQGYATHVAENIVKKLQAELGIHNFNNTPHEVLKELIQNLTT